MRLLVHVLVSQSPKPRQSKYWTAILLFQGKEGFEQEETKTATEGQIKSEIKNKGKPISRSEFNAAIVKFLQDDIN